MRCPRAPSRGRCRGTAPGDGGRRAGRAVPSRFLLAVPRTAGPPEGRTVSLRRSTFLAHRRAGRCTKPRRAVHEAAPGGAQRNACRPMGKRWSVAAARQVRFLRVPPERDRTGTPAATTVPVEAGIVTAATAAVSAQSDGRSAHAALPGVLADVPVAVLVIDQRTSRVTYANVAAVEMAGNVGLPVDVDGWGSAAGLPDLSGAPPASTTGPL